MWELGLATAAIISAASLSTNEFEFFGIGPQTDGIRSTGLACPSEPEPHGVYFCELIRRSFGGIYIIDSTVFVDAGTGKVALIMVNFPATDFDKAVEAFTLKYGPSESLSNNDLVFWTDSADTGIIMRRGETSSTFVISFDTDDDVIVDF